MTHKFKVGQKVYVPNHGRITEDAVCDICGGNKQVAISGREFPCPNCLGAGHYFTTGYLPVERKIQKVIISIEFDNVSIEYKFENRQRFDEEDVFMTEEACQVECDIINGMMNK